MNIPMKEKYVDEHFKPLMIFGSSENGKVDVDDCDGNTIMTLPKEVADKVIQANRKYFQELYSILSNFNKD